ncbi:WYL domain-containing protein [Nonomuraea rubra]|uniref:WYL domain-containing protein n=1 Tax=Nonomuraea rubra TaxID=46180 RepID=UPI003CD060FD
MRASRLVSILLMLQTRGRMTARELADRLEVLGTHHLPRRRVPARRRHPPLRRRGAEGRLPASRRLPDPAHGPDGRRGGVPVPGGAARPRGRAGPGHGGGGGAAQADGGAAGRAEGPRGPHRRERFLLDAPHLGTATQDRRPTWPPWPDAVWNERRIQIRYRRWKEPQEVERRLEPYGLVVKAGLVVSGGPGGLRTCGRHRVSQILASCSRWRRSSPGRRGSIWPPTGRGRYLAEFEARLRWGEAVVCGCRRAGWSGWPIS